LRWIKNDKLPQRLELRDYFHAFETEERRSEMLGYCMSMMHLLHISDIVTSQCNQAHRKKSRPEGVATIKVAWALVPKGDQAWPSRVGRGISQKHLVWASGLK